MKRLLLLVLITAFLLNSCNSAISDPEETSDIESTTGSISISPETTILPETEPETEPEVTWHYPTFRENNPTWCPTDTGEYPDEIKNTYLTFPLVYEAAAYGFEYLIEFYNDTVYMQDYIYYRITVTNTTDSVQWYGGSLSNAGVFKRDDGEQLKAIANYGWSFSDETSDMHGINPGTSHTYEIMFRADHNFFNLEHGYVFLIGIYPITTPHLPWIVEIPIPIAAAN